jgi:hypothetical protein
MAQYIVLGEIIGSQSGYESFGVDNVLLGIVEVNNLEEASLCGELLLDDLCNEHYQYIRYECSLSYVGLLSQYKIKTI